MMLGDGEGNAVVVEWVDGEIRVLKMSGNYMIATNFLLSETNEDEIQCPRYRSMDERARQLIAKGEEADLRSVGNIIGGAVQVAREDESGRLGGTLYSTFMDISEMQMILVPRLDNDQLIRLDLKEEFGKGRRRQIRLQ
jgi:choloylglycine hydrolase